ncbi:AbrB/MazE/SpoVT family DNA-binding domain-containing protein [Candidatus Woesearchaeota archaeon]|nr:AbrB/MazE/SpoVT family DNA-binding domain-containing protein [Candidatus Woesearchaeota archaeon]
MKHKIFDEIPELVRLSSKGQLVIPQDIRKARHIGEGSVFAVSSPKEDILILKKITNPLLQEDLEILKDVEEAWEELKQGKYKESSKKEFLNDLESW